MKIPYVIEKWDRFCITKTDYVNSVDYSSNTVYNYYDNGTLTDYGPLKEVSVKDSSDNTLASVSYQYEDGILKNINRGGNLYEFDTERGGVVEGPFSDYTRTAVELHPASGTSTTLVKNFYDQTGNLTYTVYDDGTYGDSPNYTSFDYDVTGKLISKTTPNNEYEYLYNSRGNLSVVNTNDGDQVDTYSYDAADRLIGARTRYYLNGTSSASQFTYDEINQVVSLNTKTLNGTQERVVRTEFTYRPDGSVSGQSFYSSETGSTQLVLSLSYSYNEIGMLDGIVRGQQMGNQFSHTSDISIEYTPTDSGELTSLVSEYENSFDFIDNYQPETVINDSYYSQYQYDDLGNISSVTDQNGYTTTYTYDALNQLTSCTVSHYDCCYLPDEEGNEVNYEGIVSEVELFTYDSYGNILTKTSECIISKADITCVI